MLQHLTEQNKFTVGNNQKKIEEKISALLFNQKNIL